MNPPADSITLLLRRFATGEPRAAEQLLPLVYEELRALAARRLGGERPGHTLSPTALVHEVYLRFARDESFAPEDRRQFFAAATTSGSRYRPWMPRDATRASTRWRWTRP